MPKSRTKNWVDQQRDVWITPKKYEAEKPSHLPRSAKRPRRILPSDSDESDEVMLGESSVRDNTKSLAKTHSVDSSPPTTDGELEATVFEK